MIDKAAVRANRIKLVVLFAMFFGPVLAAWIMVLTGWRPVSMVNHGTLVEPPAPVAEAGLLDAEGGPLPAQFFAGHWTVLLADSGTCADGCRQALDQLGRVLVALNKDQDRVKVAVIAPQAAAAPQLPSQVVLVKAPPATLEAWKPSRQPDYPAVHMVDPAGYRMMVYPLPLDGNGLLKDLRRLLRVSNEDTERLRQPAQES